LTFFNNMQYSNWLDVGLWRNSSETQRLPHGYDLDETLSVGSERCQKVLCRISWAIMTGNMAAERTVVFLLLLNTTFPYVITIFLPDNQQRHYYHLGPSTCPSPNGSAPPPSACSCSLCTDQLQLSATLRQGYKDYADNSLRHRFLCDSQLQGFKG
jgi:hypothetical protein